MIKLSSNSELFGDLSFVLRARSKDKIKPVFTLLCVTDLDGQRIAACSDSRRLHFAPCEFEPGLYEVVKSTSKEIILNLTDQEHGRFPDISKVIPTLDESWKKILVSWNKPSNGARAMFILAKHGICINPKYIEDAVSDKTPVYVSAPNNPIFVVHGSGAKAILMPIFTPESLQYETE
jgi:hypothetical protein